ncbi:hypothetical protein HC931_23370 [Candidatus Gracilibacteria bacterium]|jgi:hypothetical protein|nr:hypothetical protein [Candidatus Gracilibacteria bacterium]NJM86165.1 hypothetical protein [Hydrococcus sp. RU_2_2]NJP19133.1 hypothetical protein [Hydrococcus sp. CRU_1_1]NJQ96542.1 hypothetical protein [Hydrococcus sp. CSU_1_8]
MAIARNLARLYPFFIFTQEWVQSKVVGGLKERSPLKHLTEQFSLMEGGVTARKKVVSLETKNPTPISVGTYFR